MQLAKPEIAPKLVDYLQGQQEKGMAWLVYDRELDIQSTLDVTCFKKQRDAHAFLNAGFANPLHLDVDTIGGMLKKLEETIKHQQTIEKKENTMNMSKLEEQLGYLEDVKIDPAIINTVRGGIEKGVPNFNVTEQYLPEIGTKGVIDFELPVRKSGQSDNYYMDRFELTFSKADPLPEKHSYYVVSQEDGKKLHRAFTSPVKAIEYLNKKEGQRELVTGTGPTPDKSETLVRKDGNELMYVKPDFKQAYHSKPIRQPFSIQEGQGFSLPQALRLIQGKGVYKDNLLDASGQQYKAYILINREEPLTNGTGFRYRPLRDPEYGYEPEKLIKQEYDIIEARDDKKFPEMMAKLKDGERVNVTAQKNGKQYKVAMELSPRYKNINFFDRNGQSLGREFFNRKNRELKNPMVMKREWDLTKKQGMRL